VSGFADRHGSVVLTSGRDVVTLVAEDGATADLEVPWPPLQGAGVEALAGHAAATRTALLVLVRRGGYAAGLARDGVVLEHAVGTRYVQGRTAAGGWSQQRFARRRRGQAEALAEAAAEAALRVLARGPAPDVVVPGGDRLLVTAVLSDRRLSAAAALPRGPLLDVPDPRLAVLQDAAGRCRAVRVRVCDPPS
jgi:hypothetical protein